MAHVIPPNYRFIDSRPPKYNHWMTEDVVYAWNLGQGQNQFQDITLLNPQRRAWNEFRRDFLDPLLRRHNKDPQNPAAGDYRDLGKPSGQGGNYHRPTITSTISAARRAILRMDPRFRNPGDKTEWSRKDHYIRWIFYVVGVHCLPGRRWEGEEEDDDRLEALCKISYHMLDKLVCKAIYGKDAWYTDSGEQAGGGAGGDDGDGEGGGGAGGNGDNGNVPRRQRTPDDGGVPRVDEDFDVYSGDDPDDPANPHQSRRASQDGSNDQNDGNDGNDDPNAPVAKIKRAFFRSPSVKVEGSTSSRAIKRESGTHRVKSEARRNHSKVMIKTEPGANTARSKIRRAEQGRVAGTRVAARRAVPKHESSVPGRVSCVKRIKMEKSR